MSHQDVQPPDLLPILSPGKHRNPGTGACFTELASLLAGERWSDHPACTHPLLAAVARQVNDHTSDAGRHRLADLVPSVIGLTCDRVLADLDGRAPGTLEEQSRLALAKAPQAAEWAYQFTSGVRPSHEGFRRQAAPTIVRDAVEGIAQACVPDPRWDAP